MKIIWTEGAANDLTEIVGFIMDDSPDAARRVAKVIYDQISSLVPMPHRGRKRLSDNARELVFSPWPYVAVYEVIDDKIFIEGIRHTARNDRQHP